jgi:hypothetical protein
MSPMSPTNGEVPMTSGPRHHPSTEAIMRYFAYDHLPAGLPRLTSMRIGSVAKEMLDALPEGPELTAGLRKLLEAKDCFVRAALDYHD